MSTPADAGAVPACPGCGGAGRPTTTDLVFSDGGITVRVAGVPATACDACGEVFVAGPLGVRIGDEVAEVLRLVREGRAAGIDRATEPRVVVLAAAKPTPNAA